MTKQLRESRNVIEIEGTIVDVRLEEREINGKAAITGEIDIDTGNDNKHTVNAFSYKITSKGNESGLVTVMNEYQKGDKVRIGRGQHGENKYIGQDGSLKSYPRINSSYFNRVDNIAEPKAKFSIEMAIQSIKDETRRQGEEQVETGNKLISGFTVDYNGKLVPVTLTVQDSKLASKVDSAFDKGDTVTFHGDVLNIERKETKVIEADFGDDEVITTTKYERGYVVTGGKKTSEDKAYETKDIKQALAERNEEIEEMKKKKEAKGDSGKASKPASKTKNDDPFGDNDPFGDDGKNSSSNDEEDIW